MRRIIALTTFTWLWFGLSSAAEEPIKPPIRKLDFDIIEKKSDCGFCLAVNKNSILICDIGKAPKSYPFHDRLASGEVQKKAGESKSYRVEDIQVGDIVSLGLITENKQDFCVDLGIHERPGGVIPPGQVVNQKRPWYQWQNAQIAFCDKGIPIPEHLKPEGVKFVEQLQREEKLKKK